VVGLTVSGVYAAGLLRGRTDAHHRLGFTVPFVFGTVAAVAQPLVGHVLGMRIHDTQPAKLAAFELAETAESPAPFRLGGVLIDGHVHGALEIPRLGSIIARNSLDAPVPGLDTVPEQDWPPVTATHLAAVVVLYWLLRWRGRDLLDNRWFLRFSVVAGPLAILTMELGWVATEVGRQPWTVWQILRTTDAASMATGLWWSYTAVLVIYLGMTVGAAIVLRSMATRWRAGETDLPSPYGPPQEEPVP
jgi:cytochrome bd ubiquinol oxidase subunit I